MLLLVVGLMTAACGTGGLPATPSPPASSPPATPGAVPATAAPSAMATPATTATAAAPTPLLRPPEATLVGLQPATEGPLQGSMGTFTWDGLVSDSGWIVPTQGGAAAAGAPLEIAFVPELEQVAWRARWAPVTNNRPGDPVAGGDGGAGPIRIAAPDVAGTWSLVIEASYPGGNEASWFWRVEVMP